MCIGYELSFTLMSNILCIIVSVTGIKLCNIFRQNRAMRSFVFVCGKLFKNMNACQIFPETTAIFSSIPSFGSGFAFVFFSNMPDMQIGLEISSGSVCRKQSFRSD